LKRRAPGAFVFDGWHILDAEALARAGIDYRSPGKYVSARPP